MTDPLENWLMSFSEDVESGSLRAATTVRDGALKKLREVIPLIATLRAENDRLRARVKELEDAR